MYLARPLAILALALSTSACTVFVRSATVSHNQADPVPADRVLAYQTPSAGLTKVVITRDEGMNAMGCYLGVKANSTLIGRFAAEETATFYLPAGVVDMTVIQDPQGGGLCGKGFLPGVTTSHLLSADKPYYMRISTGNYRRPRVLETND